MTLEELNVFCEEMYKRLEFKSHSERLAGILKWAEGWQSKNLLRSAARELTCVHRRDGAINTYEPDQTGRNFVALAFAMMYKVRHRPRQGDCGLVPFA